MAFSLAMHLSGMEQQYFYDVGAKDLYDASANLMTGVNLNPENPNPLLAKFPSVSCDNDVDNNKHHNRAINGIVQSSGSIMSSIFNSQGSASASPSSTSSGFISEESRDDISTNMAYMAGNTFFNFQIPPPPLNTVPSRSSLFHPPSAIRESEEISSTSDINFPPIGMRIKNDLTAIQPPNNFVKKSDKNTENAIRQQFIKQENNTDNKILNNLQHETIPNNLRNYDYNSKKAIIYQNRDLLDLGLHLFNNLGNWNYVPAQLQTGNSRFFFENRSQYHRLATSTEYVNDDFLEPCNKCGFLLPKF